MNKVILMGRLTKDPEIRYTQEYLAVARYTLAINRRFQQQGQAEVDFIPCIAFGKTAQFAEKYFSKGQQIAITGRLQIRSWEIESGQRQWNTEVVVEEQYFAGSKKQETNSDMPEGLYPASEEEELPF